jgi:PIN domain nuclease of toxin-antitoxin system
VSEVVLDASALLAVLRKEPGKEVVEPVVIGAAVSAVNYSEVIKKAVEAGGNASETHGLLRLMDLAVVAFDEPQAVAAGELFRQTRSMGLSFADRACLGLGISRKWPVITAEKRFAETGLPVEVRLIRGKVH